jgi:crotonobetainyl-CoA:carnitine CoA-transferase CaiB-like acyl-CoA transferase
MGLLDGITILDMTRLLPGPLATMHLADQGATVIKIEDRAKGDYARSDLALGKSMSALFHALNRGKASVALDLKAPAEREHFLALVDKADVVVESFRPGVMDSLGLGPAALRARRPALIVCSITAYGQTGPLAAHPAHDNNMCGYSGIADQFPRGPDDRIAAPNFQIADIAGGGLTAAMAIAMALLRRERTGVGATIDLAMSEASLAAAIMPFAMRQAFGATPRPGSDILTGALACYGYFRCKDAKHIAMGALEPKFWRLFCGAVGRPDWIMRQMSLGDAAEALRAEMAEMFLTRTRDEWTALLEPIEACVTPVLSLDEAIAHEQFAARGLFSSFTDAVDGTFVRIGAPFLVDGERAMPTAPAPRHGEHSALA